MIKVLNKHTATAGELKDSVSVMRPSVLGNPFKVMPYGPYSRDEAVEAYEAWLRQELANKNARIRNVMNALYLAAKQGHEVKLLCWLSPQALPRARHQGAARSDAGERRVTMQAEVFTRRTDRFDLWVGKQTCADFPFVTEVFIKVEEGVKHLVHRYDSLNVSRALADARRYGRVSKRPYILGQACDGSIASPVMALFAHCCEALGFDPVALHIQAYSDEPEPGFEEVTAFAFWQSVTYPRTWDEGAVGGLLASLTTINNHALVSAFLEALANRESDEERGP